MPVRGLDRNRKLRAPRHPQAARATREPALRAVQLVAQKAAQNQPHQAEREAFRHADHRRSHEREFDFLPERKKGRLAAHQAENPNLFQPHRIRLPAPQPRQLDLHVVPSEQHVCHSLSITTHTTQPIEMKQRIHDSAYKVDTCRLLKQHELSLYSWRVKKRRPDAHAR